MKVLGLIPARLGSKGVPLKNLRPLDGRPLIAHSIETALASRLDRVIVSTEAEEIAEAARKAGAEVPFMRPDALAIDSAGAVDVAVHALDALRELDGSEYDCLMYLQPTSPFRQSSEIDAAIDLMENGNATSVHSVTQCEEHPYYIYQPAENGRMKPFMEPDNLPERRQDMPMAFASNCAIFLSRCDFLRKVHGSENASLIDYEDFLPLEVGFPTSIDIDSWQDFMLAEFAILKLDILRDESHRVVSL
jgi:N-acylneuraminate cytidylyltransferase/CMP-N,N'-diacetyllegionaminic acid synthase